jgi:predicted phage tail protein
MRPNIQYDVPSTAETMGKFFMDIALYAILAWYFDHVDSSNRGKNYGYLFFLKGNYWKFSKGEKVKQNIDASEINELNNQIDQAGQKLLSKAQKKLNNISSNINSINDSLASLDSEEDASCLGLKSVLEEKLKILRNEQSEVNNEGLRILGCSKTYLIANKCCGSRQVKALKDVNLN